MGVVVVLLLLLADGCARHEAAAPLPRPAVAASRPLPPRQTSPEETVAPDPADDRPWVRLTPAGRPGSPSADDSPSSARDRDGLGPWFLHSGRVYGDARIAFDSTAAQAPHVFVRPHRLSSRAPDDLLGTWRRAGGGRNFVLRQDGTVRADEPGRRSDGVYAWAGRTAEAHDVIAVAFDHVEAIWLVERDGPEIVVRGWSDGPAEGDRYTRARTRSREARGGREPARRRAP